MTKVLVVISNTSNCGALFNADSAVLRLACTSNLFRAAEELKRDSFDAVVLADPATEEDLAWFLAQLSRRNQTPELVCLTGERTEALEKALSSRSISYRRLAALHPDALFDSLSGLSPDAPALGPNTEADTDWEKALIGESSAMKRIREVIRLVASRQCTVLITGESGTGKEGVARALHLASQRVQGPLVSINCAAVPGTLLESEMFGHEKGAFTGASTTRVGCFEQANQGTIFLDEIGDMPLELQAKILRVLQEKEIHRIGRSTPIRIDARVVAATNRNLSAEAAEGRFRQDLFFRLRVIPIHLPPLRERVEDIAPLVDHFLGKICGRERIVMKRIGPGVLAHLEEQPWPGNVRELEHSLERAIALSGERRVLDLCDFTPFCDVMPMRPQEEPVFDSGDDGIDFQQIIGRLERALIDHALQRSRGNKARAAQLLGLKRSTLISKVKAFEMCAC